MDVNCPVCDKPFPPSLISYHAEHCLFSSFTDGKASSGKRSISELMEYDAADQTISTASYPRKRQQHCGHTPPTTGNVAYYPKEASDYRRVVGGGNSAVGGRNIGSGNAESWGGGNAPPKPSAPKALMGMSRWSPTRNVSKPVMKPYRSIPRVPERSPTSHPTTNRNYVRPVPPPPLLSSSASSVKIRAPPSLTDVVRIPPKVVSSNGTASSQSKSKVLNSREVITFADKPKQSVHSSRQQAVNNAAAAGKQRHADDVDKQQNSVRNKKNNTLLDNIRPTTFAELVGHSDVLGPTSHFRVDVDAAKCVKAIVWGPPGCGKTSLGRVLAVRFCGNEGPLRFRGVSGATVTRDALLAILIAAKSGGGGGGGGGSGSGSGSGSGKTLLFVDDLHCMERQLQLLLAPSLERGDIAFVGASLSPPADSVCGPLLSRCEVYQMEALTPADIEVLVRRALKRGLVQVMSRETEVHETEQQTDKLNQAMIRGYYNKNAGVVVAKEEASVKQEPMDVGDENFMVADCIGNEHVSIKQELITEIKTENADDFSQNASEIGNTVNKGVNKAKIGESGKKTSQPNDNGIEDMSEEEDESILDVLTKDLDQIGNEFSTTDQEVDTFKVDGIRLKDINDLDCVSDEDLPDHKPNIKLESIDSSEDEMDDDSSSGMYYFRSVGMTHGAVSWLSSHCSGDARLALNTLLLLLTQAKSKAIKVRDNDRKVRLMVAKLSKGKTVQKQPDTIHKEANYPMAAAVNNKKHSHAKGDSLTTDDISSDEDNEAINAKPGANFTKNNNSNNRMNKGHDLDNVSDVSENSGHLDDDSSKEGATICLRDGTGIVAKELDSDDVLSEALSDDDVLDYGEIDDDDDVAEEDGTTETNDTGGEDECHVVVTVGEDSKDCKTNFSNNAMNGRLSTMLFCKGGGQAIAPSKLSKSNLKIVKRPVKNKLLYSNPGIMKNSIRAEQKSKSFCVVEVGEDFTEAVSSTRRRAVTRQPGRVYAVVTVLHVKEALQHRGRGSSEGLHTALQRSIAAGDGNAALYWTARLLHAAQQPAAVAKTLLAVAVTVVGTGSESALSTALNCVQAVPLLGATQHCHSLLANTAVALARAPKDTSAVEGLALAAEHISSCSGTLPSVPLHLCSTDSNAGDDETAALSLLPPELNDTTFLTEY